MAKLSKDELIEKVRKYVGDRKDDETIEIIEDISDSIDSSEADDWKKKYEENDKMWRDKYISRFVEKKKMNQTHRQNTTRKRKSTTLSRIYLKRRKING